MLKIQFIGNLCADAERKTTEVADLMKFRVAVSLKRTDRSTGAVTESTTFIGCTARYRDGLFPYLRRGEKIFGVGSLDVGIYFSVKMQTQLPSVDCFCDYLELCGGARPSEIVPNNSSAVSASDNEEDPF